MIKIKAEKKDIIEDYFHKSVYTNSHLGWFDWWEIPRGNGSFWVDDSSKGYFIALQRSGSDTLWLHDFYAASAPEGYPLAKTLRSVLPSGRHSVYTISSHNWFSNLLKENGFSASDEIIQLETEDIFLPSLSYDSEINPFDTDLAEMICNTVETAFPPLWRFSLNELLYAWKCSNYKRIACCNGQPAGYLLADIQDDNAHIERIAVSSVFHHTGIGSSLLNCMIRDCLSKGIGKFGVNTNRKNASAVSLYKKMNFRITGKTYPVFHRNIYGKL